MELQEILFPVENFPSSVCKNVVMELYLTVNIVLLDKKKNGPRLANHIYCYIYRNLLGMTEVVWTQSAERNV